MKGNDRHLSYGSNNAASAPDKRNRSSPSSRGSRATLLALPSRSGSAVVAQGQGLAPSLSITECGIRRVLLVPPRPVHRMSRAALIAILDDAIKLGEDFDEEEVMESSLASLDSASCHSIGHSDYTRFPPCDGAAQ